MSQLKSKVKLLVSDEANLPTHPQQPAHSPQLQDRTENGAKETGLSMCVVCPLVSVRGGRPQSGGLWISVCAHMCFLASRIRIVSDAAAVSPKPTTVAGMK